MIITAYRLLSNATLWASCTPCTVTLPDTVVLSLLVAVMVALPTPLTVTVPLLFTTAMLSLSEVQSTDLLLALVGATFAFN